MTVQWGVEMASWKLVRDVAIVSFSLGMGGYEILLGGGRPSVLTFLSGLLLSPIVMRVDLARRSNPSDGDGT